MKRPISVLSVTLFLFLSSLSLSAQVLQGTNASDRLPGTDAIRYVAGQSRPQFIRFAAGERFSLGTFDKFYTDEMSLSPRESLRLKNETIDPQGYRHIRYEQHYDGKRVMGGNFIIHGRKNLVETAAGELYDSFEAPSASIISASEALANALADSPAELYAWDVFLSGDGIPYVEKPTPELVWVPRSLDFSLPMELAYEVTVHAFKPLFRERLFISASDGTVIARENRLHTSDEPGTALTALSGERPIVANRQPNGTYHLHDEGRGIRTLDVNQNPDTFQAVEFVDADNFWNNVNTQLDQYATDAHWGAEVFSDMLMDLGRNGIDGNGVELTNYVHFDFNLSNAFYDGNAAFFGDGGSPLSTIDQPVLSIDVVGHEFTHGLIQYTADLIYSSESGALNESFADIFGYMTSFAGRGEAGTAWKIGAEITSSGEGIRSFVAPSIFEHPDTYGGEFWEDFAGVHTNSSVQNHWFYLLATGEQGNNEFGEAYDIEALGRDTAFAIAYRNLTVYLTESSDYDDAAFYSLLSAQDLYGSCSSTYLATNEAWRAVGLGQMFPAEFSALFSATQTHCDVPAVVTFSNLSSLFSNVSWDFGDGTTSTEISPSHTYTSIGSFDVSLAIEGCNGERDTLLLEDYITLDPESLACDTTIMVSSQTIVLNSCEGVITDPGGADDVYGNSQSASVLINPPSGGSVILDFSEFTLESNFDFLYLYDGDSRDAPLIGSYSGSSLLGQTIESTGSEIFLHFESDGSVTRDGFVCSYQSSGGNASAQAAFSVSNDTPAFNEPVTFSATSATSGGVDFYDFGDGTSASGANQATHQYQSAGTFTVTQYVSSCIDRDTITGIVTVSEPGTITVNPDSICVTMLSNDSLEQFITVTNAGPGPLYYGASLDNDEFDFFSEKSFLNRVFTAHELTFPSDAEVINLSFTLNGNFDEGFEGADIYLNNRYYQSLGYDEESAPNGTDIIQTFTLTGGNLDFYTTNGSVSVTIENDFRVANTDAGQSIHRVSLSYPGSELVNLEGPRAGTVANGDSAVFPVMLRSTGLLGGTYTSLLLLETGDPERPIIETPVKVLVIGQPELLVTPTDITFGETYIGFPNAAEVTLTNSGTGAVLISAISLSDEVNYRLSVGTQEMVIPPGESEQFTVIHDPVSAASHPAQLTISSNVPDEVINITGLGIAPANVNFSPDTLCFIIEGGAEVTQQLFFSNTGTGVLTWRFSSPADFPVPFTFSSGSGTTTPEEAEMVDVTIDGNSLAVGTFYYDMPFLSNIPESQTINVPVKVIVRSAPVAVISPLRESYCDNNVQFTDESTANPTSWAWNFGDGSSSTDQSPSHFYTASGEYTVTLEVCNDLGCTSAESSVLITLGGDFCTEIIMEDDQTQSVSSCTGTIYDDGGPDGSYSNGINSTLIINPVGAESIELEVVSFLTESCCDYLRVYQGDIEDNILIGSYRGSDLAPESIISVPGEKTTILFETDGSVTRSGFEIRWRCVRSEPIPSFTVVASEDCSNRMQFNNTSANATSHLWDFGDGTTSTEINPLHDFGSLGAFDVTLTAVNESFRDSLTQTIAIGGLPFDLELDFPETVMIDEVVDFRTISNVELSDHQWSLGIGSTISLASPQFVYAEAGTYTISLQVLGPDGCGMTQSRDLRVDFRTGVRQSSNGISYKLYPNPTNGLAALEIDLPGGPATTNLRLVDALGRTVLEQPILADNTMIDTRSFATGVYWVQVFREGSLLLTDRLLVRR